MKIIAEQYYSVLVDEILKEKFKQCRSENQPFIGLTNDELQIEIEKRLGKPWAIEIRKISLSIEQVKDLANGQFFRETGRTLLMGLAIIILGLSVGVKWIPNIAPLYYNIYLTLCGVIGLGFIYVYGRKLRKVREDLKWKYGVRESEGDK